MIRVSRKALACAALLALAAPACADEIRHPTAEFEGLDKITGRIISFEVAIDETVQFGTLQITPRVCLTRPQTEAPLTDGFVEVDEIENARQAKRIFSGWMFAASPGLHGVEHPVYDVWLKDCIGGKDVIVTSAPPNAQPDVNAPPPPNATQAPSEPPKKAQRTITPQKPVEPQVDAPPPDDAAPPAAPDAAKNPAAQPGDLGAPVEVGAAPGAGPANPADPAAAPPKPKKKKRKPKPPPQPDAFPGDAPVDPAPRRERLEPVSPDDLPRGGGFFR